MKMNNESTSQQTTFLAIGDVHGNWTRVIEAIQSATDILGHSPDMVLQVGDAEALRSEAEMAMVAGPPKYKWLGEFQLLQPGDLACPVYFIAGNHEPYEALDAAERDTTIPIPWGPNVYYLGRAGAMSLGGLNIAWLSGIEIPRNLEQRRNGKAGYHYIISDVEKTKREARRLSGIDVVITHDWPSGIKEGVGTDLIRSLTHELQPQLHVCGHMHSPRESEVFSTKVHALNTVPSSWRVNGSYGWWRLYRKENGVTSWLATISH